MPWIATMSTWREGGAFSCTRGAIRLITCKAILAGVDLPVLLVEPNCKACPAFHIKGMCNMGCRNAAGHVAQTWEQDLPFWVWAVRAMPEITAPSALVTSIRI